MNNHREEAVSGVLRGEISRQGKPTIGFEKNVSLLGSQTVEVAFTASEVPQLSVRDPDLWWPYRWGEPNLYHLKLEFVLDGKTSDSQEGDFGIREITQHRDQDNSFPEIGSGGNFYLQINGATTSFAAPHTLQICSSKMIRIATLPSCATLRILD